MYNTITGVVIGEKNQVRWKYKKFYDSSTDIANVPKYSYIEGIHKLWTSN